MIKLYIRNILSNLPESNRIERIWKIAQVDFKKRYYNDRLGILWAFMNPVIRLLVYYYAFTVFMNKVTADIPNYGLFIFTALIFWIEFTQILRKGTKLLINKRYLIENIKMSIIDLYTSLALASFFGFLFNLIAYLFIAIIFGVKFNFQILYLFVIITTLYLLSIGISMIFSVIHIYAKDINHLIDIIILIGFWTSGVFFSPQIIIEKFPILYYLNPFLGLFTNARSILVYNSDIDIVILNINLIFSLFVYICGYFFIKNYSHKALEKF